MKKLRIAILALGLIALSALPSKQAGAAGNGHYSLTIYSLSHWICNPGGGICCPGFDC
jgi:hypothetical protein